MQMHMHMHMHMHIQPRLSNPLSLSIIHLSAVFILRSLLLWPPVVAKNHIFVGKFNRSQIYGGHILGQRKSFPILPVMALQSSRSLAVAGLLLLYPLLSVAQTTTPPPSNVSATPPPEPGFRSGLLY